MKLIKTEVNYLLKNEEGVIIASTSTKEGNNKLSKQNCDEIFWGLYDTEIEVEIETTMRPVWGDESSMRATYVTKLDSEGCLILKKI